ncbi:MAG: thioredoxin family protein [Campylobacterales bacterium]
MNKLLAIVLFWITPLLALNWAKTANDARQAAQREGKMIMVMLSQEGCTMCDYMKNVTLKHPDIETIIESRFIPLEIDIHSGMIPTGLRAYGTPTFYFTDTNFKKIGRHFVGGAKPEAFADVLRKVGH